MIRPTNVLKPMARSCSDFSKNILPHFLKHREYDLEWLKWAIEQTYILEENTISDFKNRIKEIENNG